MLPKLCFVCKDMYGNPIFNNMCSKCFKNSKSQEEEGKIKLNKKET